MIKRVLWSIFGLLLLGIIALVYLSGYSSAPPAPAHLSKAAIAAAAGRLRNAVKHPAPASVTSSGQIGDHARRDISVRFAQDDVNTMLSSNADVQRQLAAQGIAAAQIAFVPPADIRVNAWYDSNGVKRQAQVTGRLEPAADGGLTFHTVGTKVGLLPLPSGMSAGQIDGRADKLIDQALPTLPLDIDSVEVTNGQLVLSGPAKKHAAERLAAPAGNSKPEANKKAPG